MIGVRNARRRGRRGRGGREVGHSAVCVHALDVGGMGGRGGDGLVGRTFPSPVVASVASTVSPSGSSTAVGASVSLAPAAANGRPPAGVGTGGGVGAESSSSVAVAEEEDREAAADEDRGPHDAAEVAHRVQRHDLAHHDDRADAEQHDTDDVARAAVPDPGELRDRGRVLVARERDPADRVGRDAETAREDRHDHPDHAHDGHVDAERVGHAGRHAGEPLALLPAHEAPRRAAGRARRPGGPEPEEVAPGGLGSGRRVHASIVARAGGSHHRGQPGAVLGSPSAPRGRYGSAGGRVGAII